MIIRISQIDITNVKKFVKYELKEENRFMIVVFVVGLFLSV